MMIKMRLLVAAAAASLFATGAVAQSVAPTQWSTGAGGNGHYYGFVASGDIDWTAALAAAPAAPVVAGYQSYLTTITSAAENAFVAALTTQSGWIGGSDAGNEGTFTWRNGPETGNAFTFTSWNSGEPNNCCGGENYVQFSFGGNGLWNDLQGPVAGQTGYIQGYFVEYSPISGVPEPSTWAMMLAGFGAAGYAMRRRRVATLATA